MKKIIKERFPFLIPLLGPAYAAFRDWRFRFTSWQVRYNQPGLITEAACDFMNDERYLRSVQVAKEACGRYDLDRGGDWRMYLGCWAAEHAKNLEGDFVECGVDRGIMSRTQVEYIGFKNLKKTFYLVDLFGVSLDPNVLSPEELKLEERSQGYNHSVVEVRKAFHDIPNVKVFQGSVPEIFPSFTVEKVAYIHIDMNCVAPEIAAAEYFWDKMVPGAIMLLCDYNIYGRKPQREAFNAWAKTKGVSVLALPSTQGMIIKP